LRRHVEKVKYELCIEVLRFLGVEVHAFGLLEPRKCGILTLLQEQKCEMICRSCCFACASGCGAEGERV
jgi:hypothetical protein